MKMLSFILLCCIIGMSIAWFFLVSKKERKKIWNSKTRLTILIMFGTMFMLFSVAVIGSMFTVKLF